jgi:hypothetical protein
MSASGPPHHRLFQISGVMEGFFAAVSGESASVKSFAPARIWKFFRWFFVLL